MKQTNNIISKLASYSVAAAAVMAANPASAELIGYDVDPDSTHGYPGDTTNYYTFNINNVGDGCDEINDLFLSFGSYSISSLFVYGNAYYDNEIFGNLNPFTYSSQTITNTITTTYGATSTTQYIGTSTVYWRTGAVVSSGSSISASMSGGTFIKEVVDMAWWYSSTTWGAWGGGKTDKYLGLRFYAYTQDTETTPGDTIWDSTLHYGWIYLDVALNAKSMTIKSWAYETEPDMAAACNQGAVNFMQPTCFAPLPDAEGTIGISERNGDTKVSIYSYGRDVKVNSSKATKGSVAIYNVSGQKLQEDALTGKSNTIRVNGRSEGVHFVRVQESNGDVHSKRVFIK